MLLFLSCAIAFYLFYPLRFILGSAIVVLFILNAALVILFVLGAACVIVFI